MRGATRRQDLPRAFGPISIHAPHAGSDRSTRRAWPCCIDFNPRSPCGERLSEAIASAVSCIFQSTLPMRGATMAGASTSPACRFQSTLPMRGATLDGKDVALLVLISIHAPHAGSDRYIVYANIKCYAIYWTVEQLICCYCISSRHLLNLCTAFKVRRVLAHDDHLEFAPQNDKNPCGS